MEHQTKIINKKVKAKTKHNKNQLNEGQNQKKTTQYNTTQQYNAKVLLRSIIAGCVVKLVCVLWLLHCGCCVSVVLHLNEIRATFSCYFFIESGQGMKKEARRGYESLPRPSTPLNALSINTYPDFDEPSTFVARMVQHQR